MATLTTLDLKDVHEVFIETGYGWGNSLRNIVKYAFNSIHSIEIDPSICDKAKTEWRSEPRVTIHEGDSRNILPLLLNPQRSTTVWLDAHYSGTIYYGESKPITQCPILEEIEIVTSLLWTKPVTLLIDDIRLFTDEWWATTQEEVRRYLDPKQWPRITDLERSLSGLHVDKSIPDIWIARF